MSCSVAIVKRWRSRRGDGDFVENGEVVTGGGGEHQPVPDRVLVGQAIPHVEGDTDRVDQGASTDENEVVDGQRLEHRVDGNDNGPAKAHLECDREHFPFAREDDFQDGAGNGHAPDKIEQAKAPLAADAVEK